MVRKYEGVPGLLRENPAGIVVLHSDYLALQAALREALDGWDAWLDYEPGIRYRKAEERIAELRAQFLDDK